jgi:hypothetical protein
VAEEVMDIFYEGAVSSFFCEKMFFNGFFVLGNSAYPNNDVMVSVYRGRNLPLAV